MRRGSFAPLSKPSFSCILAPGVQRRPCLLPSPGRQWCRRWRLRKSFATVKLKRDLASTLLPTYLHQDLWTPLPPPAPPVPRPSILSTQMPSFASTFFLGVSGFLCSFLSVRPSNQLLDKECSPLPYPLWALDSRKPFPYSLRQRALPRHLL